MPHHLQPTVRQLQPLGRRHDSPPMVDEPADAPVRATETSRPAASTSAPRRRIRWWRRPAARASQPS